jgi:L-alanine-DL-glutamate epimerase-like enolase superfamily enzyme
MTAAPTITAITTTIIAIPRAARLTLSGGSRDDATTVLVEVETDAGLTGIGQTLVDPPAFGAAGIKADIDAYLAPLLIGQSPFDIARLHDVMERTLPGHRATHAAIDLALWDIKGKALGVPVYELLGGRVREGIGLMAMVRHADPAAMARETDDLLRTPYPALKVKIGMGVAADIARYRAVREAAGERATIQVDGNGGYSLGEAITALGAMERLGGLGMIEQPVSRLGDLAALARRFAAPVMADESFDGPDALLEIARRGAAQAAFLKIPKQGGITGALHAAQIAEAAGIDLSVAVYSDVLAAAAAHLAAALPAITWPSFVAPLADSVLTEPLIPSGTLLSVPHGLGLGVTLDREKVRRYTVER